MFSPNTKVQVQQQMLAELGISQLACNEKYLGLPVYIGKSKKRMFEYIKQKVWTRIQGWQEKLLSKAGKEIMIKVVAQAIPTYAMACFDLTPRFMPGDLIHYWTLLVDPARQNKQNSLGMLGNFNKTQEKGWPGFQRPVHFQHCHAGQTGLEASHIS